MHSVHQNIIFNAQCVSKNTILLPGEPPIDPRRILLLHSDCMGHDRSTGVPPASVRFSMGVSRCVRRRFAPRRFRVARAVHWQLSPVSAILDFLDAGNPGTAPRQFEHHRKKRGRSFASSASLGGRILFRHSRDMGPRRTRVKREPTSRTISSDSTCRPCRSPAARFDRRSPGTSHPGVAV